LQIKEDVEKSSNISVLFSRHRSVEDPGCFFPDPGLKKSRIRIKEFKYFYEDMTDEQKKLFKKKV
jgi:hypothetical protein